MSCGHVDVDDNLWDCHGLLILSNLDFHPFYFLRIQTLFYKTLAKWWGYKIHELHGTIWPQFKSADPFSHDTALRQCAIKLRTGRHYDLSLHLHPSASRWYRREQRRLDNRVHLNTSNIQLGEARWGLSSLRCAYCEAQARFRQG